MIFTVQNIVAEYESCFVDFSVGGKKSNTVRGAVGRVAREGELAARDPTREAHTRLGGPGLFHYFIISISPPAHQFQILDPRRPGNPFVVALGWLVVWRPGGGAFFFPVTAV